MSKSNGDGAALDQLVGDLTQRFRRLAPGRGTRARLLGFFSRQTDPAVVADGLVEVAGMVDGLDGGDGENTVMPAEQFDALLAALDLPDDAPALTRLVQRDRKYRRT